MRLKLQAEPGELSQRGGALLTALAKAMHDEAPELSAVLEKAIPLPGVPDQMAYPVLQRLREMWVDEYDKQMSVMLAQIGEVLDRAADDGLAKGGFDDTKHPRAPDGRFGEVSGEHKTEPLSDSDRAKLLAEANPKAASPKEKDAMYEYQTGGYASMNALLRHGEAHKDVQDRLDVTPLHEIHENVQALQSLIKRHQITEPLTTHKGAWISPKDLATLKLNGSMDDKGFFSTSRSEAFAKKAPDMRPHKRGDTRVLYSIHMQAGQHAFDMHKESGMFAEEAEMTLPHGSNFRILSITPKKDGRKAYLHIEIEPVANTK